MEKIGKVRGQRGEDNGFSKYLLGTFWGSLKSFRVVYKLKTIFIIVGLLFVFSLLLMGI